MELKELSTGAHRVLRKNWKGGFTIPTTKLYPFQWNWDSGFISLGLSHFNLDQAIQEIQSLFSGQWENGMVPHIIFHSENEKTYFPNHDFRNSNVNNGAPQKPKTSGITQPAVIGFVLENLLGRFPDDEKLQVFISEIFPKVVNSHRFFYTYRDPEREGLTYIFHPWESGRDNSPIWDESMNRIQVKEGDIPSYQRRDTSIANLDERPTSYQYDRYVYLLTLGKKYRYDGRAIFEESPFLIQDTLMNAVLIRSNQSLIRIGERFRFDTGEIKDWQQQAKSRFAEKLWNEDLETYVGFDLRAKKQILHKEIGGLTALFAEVPNETKAKSLNKYLTDLHDRGYYLCPSFDVDSPLFDSKRYWRGPIWPQMNWMIYHGLKKYGFEDTANIVKSDLVELVSNLGFYEYFESQKSLAAQLSTGYGGGDFSWTAACIQDLITT
ncbi:MAG: glycoside hydrolase [Saprospiraceae bacterium]|nr:glycoside hydrolase [Saprospiraceae bacterium]